jgi:hypothetical protein
MNPKQKKNSKKTEKVITKIYPEMVKDLEITDTFDVIQMTIKFLNVLAFHLGIKSSDILDFFGFNKEQNPEKARSKSIAYKWVLMTPKEQEEAMVDAEKTGSKINFDQVQMFGRDLLEKAERLNGVPEKFTALLSEFDKNNPVRKQLIDLLYEALDGEISKEAINKSSQAVLIELFKRIAYRPEDETAAAFFFTRWLKMIFSGMPILSFIEQNLLTMQKQSLTNLQNQMSSTLMN